MQSATGGAEQGCSTPVTANANGGRGRILVSSASPSSSSSAVSVSNFGIDGVQHQHQMRPKRSEGNEALLAAYQTGNIPGMRVGSNYGSSSAVPASQQKHFISFSPQHGSFQVKEEFQKKGDGVVERQMMNPVHQAYLQFSLQSSPHKAATGMQIQPQIKSQDAVYSQIKSRQPMISENQAEHTMLPPPGQMNELRPSSGEQPTMWQSASVNTIRPMQTSHTVQTAANNQQAMAAQLQAMQAWALERNIDLSLPSNTNLIAQLMPLMQSRFDSRFQMTDSNPVQVQPPLSAVGRQVAPPLINENSSQGNSSSDLSGQSGSAKAMPSNSMPITNTGSQMMLQKSEDRPPISPPVSNRGNPVLQLRSDGGHENSSAVQRSVSGTGISRSHIQQQRMSMSPGMDHRMLMKTGVPGPVATQVQHIRELNPSNPQPTPSRIEISSGNQPTFESKKEINVGNQSSTQLGFGFTKHQMHVLKAQILAFRRLKKGDGSLPPELLQGIIPPPLEMQHQQVCLSSSLHRRVTETCGDPKRHLDRNQDEQNVAPPSTRQEQMNEKPSPRGGVEAPLVHKQSSATSESVRGTKGDEPNAELVVNPEKEMENGITKASTTKDEPSADKCEASEPKNSTQTCNADQSRKYNGPLFDFPFFTRKHDSFGLGMTTSNNNNLNLAYDLKDLLFEEGLEVLQKKKAENMNKIDGLLAVNFEKKRIRPDLVLRLQIEEKKLRLLEVQSRLRKEVDQQQQEIMAMSDRPYRKFVRQCERQRTEHARQVQANQKALKEKQLKSIFQWRKKLLEAHWASRDARTTRNRGIAKYHERMLRESSKRKDDDRDKRMEALKNNDVERYREMLMEQQTSIPGDAAERYAVLSSFLTQTEEYLHNLGTKIAAAKNQQEVEEASNIAAAAARTQGLSEEEVRSAAACAGEEVMIRNQFSEMNAPKESSSVNKYYNLAHAVNERVARQPSMLRAGTLRDYQLVGLQWMLSLYNNKLNGILADEMGLGKTVQVMALIAYLMEFKGNYGPHLIIVPNAVLVNWKSELHSWLPSVSCVFYVGTKDQRFKLFSQEVSATKFNVLVTTYEFIMYDRSKLSKVDWRYIIIDEAQRMKDRESVLARDLDRYKCQRRLLLTGTPLQNDLKELWSLLNLLLPDVFDNRKAFHDWFSQPFQRESSSHNAEDDWLETEKKVIIIHRLHQILEPFMLRRRVEDVEGTLPAKVSVVLRCRMSPIQSVIYDWIKSTGTLRVDPEDEKRRVQKNPAYHPKSHRTLNNRCMELRKTCNHPLLNYPFFEDLSKDFLVRSCGKLWILDRVLVKLRRTGHRVLLFSTMTKLLDILEEYLQWRRLAYRRIDGTTSLDDRESAITDFNRPGSEAFIFLLSIRAAGRGLNLQSADTVVIYDPDPNPKNEEQAVARAHRIGQTREVKVIYMEAVVDKVSSHEREDERRDGGGRTDDDDGDMAGKDRYMGSIESLIRNNIQQYKIDMADEVINAGRFDQRTTHEERRLTLETLLHDEERYQETLHDVPSQVEVNRMIARGDDEVGIFDRMDEELDWAGEMMRYEHVPDWLRTGTCDVASVVSTMSKKACKNIFESVERKRTKRMVSYADAGSSGGEEADRRMALIQARGSGSEYGPDAGSSVSSGDARVAAAAPSPSQKFASLSALDARPAGSRRTTPPAMMLDELEEGEIAASGDSRAQQSGSWMCERDEEERRLPQKLPSKLKKKRSARLRPCQTFDWTGSSRPRPLPMTTITPMKRRAAPPVSRHTAAIPFSLRSTFREVLMNPSGRAPPAIVPKMSESVHRKCKNVIVKLQRRIEREGHQIVPLLADLWKRNDSSLSGSFACDFWKIHSRIDGLEYRRVADFVADIQRMLKAAMHVFGFSHEVRTEAKKVHDLFFDIMKIAFPDWDFQEARASLSFSVPLPTSPRRAPVPPPRRHKSIREVDDGGGKNGRPRGFVTRDNDDDDDCSVFLAHPGDLVVCKKRRKERARAATAANPSAPLPPPRTLLAAGHDPVPWANPVKKTRTDSGKRRPVHL